MSVRLRMCDGEPSCHRTNARNGLASVNPSPANHSNTHWPYVLTAMTRPVLFSYRCRTVLPIHSSWASRSLKIRIRDPFSPRYVGADVCQTKNIVSRQSCSVCGGIIPTALNSLICRRVGLRKIRQSLCRGSMTVPPSLPYHNSALHGLPRIAEMIKPYTKTNHRYAFRNGRRATVYFLAAKNTKLHQETQQNRVCESVPQREARLRSF